MKFKHWQSDVKTRPSPIAAHEALRHQLQIDTERFLQHGGTITKLAPGDTAEPFKVQTAEDHIERMRRQ